MGTYRDDDLCDICEERPAAVGVGPVGMGPEICMECADELDL